MASSKKRPSAELPAKLADFLSRHVTPGQTLTLGLSGGLDSCVLLHLLAGARDTFPFRLQARHVHHGLSPHADAWAAFCADRCAALEVGFEVAQVRVSRDGGRGIEAAARALRYQALLAADGDAVVLAHHRDDQAETLLLQLLRGAGVKGLAGMGAVSASSPEQRAGSRVWLRPLLEVPRSQLLAYAQAHGLRWIEDESNLDLAYDRNFLRHRVFPALEQRFPACRATLARSAGHLAEAAELLDEVAAQDAACWVHQGRLKVAGLRAMSEARGKNLLRYWLGSRLPEAPNARRLQEIYRQLLEAGAEAQLRVALDGATVRRYRGEAWLELPEVLPGRAILHWQGQAEWRAGGGLLHFKPVTGRGLALRHLEGAPLTVQPRCGGERFQPDCRRPARSLRHCFQESGIPAWQRDSLPLIYLGETLAWVAGLGVACPLQAAPAEPGLEISWQPDVI